MSELDVEICSHFFKVSRITPRAERAVRKFARKFVQWGLERVPMRGGPPRYERTALRVFGAATKSWSEYRFHINELPNFERALTEDMIMGDMVTWVQRPIYEPVKVFLPIRPEWTDRDYQVPVIGYMVAPTPVQKLVEIQTGKGKAQPLDAKIKIPGGWKTMGEMREGDSLMAPDGSVTTVTGVHPQGTREVYEVTFADGRSTQCCAEHLWEVFYINTEPHRRWRVVNTLEVLRLISMPNPRVYVKLIHPEESAGAELPIDPYVFGLLLGDGHIGHQTLRLSSADPFIADQVAANLPSDLQLTTGRKYDYGIVRVMKTFLRNSYLVALRELGLCGKVSHEKFIPEVFLNGSLSQKFALLQGLLDTDGTVQQSGSVSYSTTSLELAQGVQYLIRSIGGLAAIRPRVTTFTYQGEKKEGRICYDVDIRYHKASALFRLPRKLERINDANQYAEALKLRVESVKPVGPKEVQCISVAHPDRLYITDDFIVTHNSYCSMRSFTEQGERVLLLVRPMYVEKWVLDLQKTYIIEDGDILLVNGSKHLLALLTLATTGQLHAKIIVISNKTMQNWIKLYETMGDGLYDLGYPCLPDQLCEVLGVGVRAIDEVHQDFHLNFKIDMYTHVPRSLSLSATLVSDDAFITNMHRLAYPIDNRYKGDPYHKYVTARAVMWRLRFPNKVRTKDYGSNTYSHHVFEKSIMRNPEMLRGYLDMVIRIVRGAFFRKDYKQGDRCLVYFASIEMCTLVVARLKKEFPITDIRRYVEEDPYENLMEAEISVSTLQSAGTAVDIPQLTTAILMVAVSSSASNIQGFGRLRELKDGRTPAFYYSVCEDIPKHIEYHERKRVLLQDRALDYQQMNINGSI